MKSRIFIVCGLLLLAFFSYKKNTAFAASTCPPTGQYAADLKTALDSTATENPDLVNVPYTPESGKAFLSAVVTKLVAAGFRATNEVLNGNDNPPSSGDLIALWKETDIEMERYDAITSGGDIAGHLATQFMGTVALDCTVPGGGKDCKCTDSTSGASFKPSTNMSVPDKGLPTDLGQLVSAIFTWSLSIIGLVIFLRFFYAGFLWFTAAGSTANTGKAITIMKNAVYGALVLFSAWLILNTINPDLVGGKIDLPGLPAGNTTSGNSSGTNGNNTAVQYNCSASATCLALPSGEAGAYPDLATCKVECEGVTP